MNLNWKAIFYLRTAVQRQQRKGFLHRIMTGDEKWIFYDNPKKKKYYAKLGQSSLPSTSTSTPRPNIHGSKEDHALYLVGPKESCLLWAAEIWRFHYGRSVSATIDSFELLREKRPEYEQRYDKVILLHDNARPHVAKIVKIFGNAQMRCFTAPAILRTLFLLITGCSERCSTIWQVTGSLLSQKSKIGSKIGSLPKSHFFEMEFENCLRGKSSRQRWTIL